MPDPDRQHIPLWAAIFLGIVGSSVLLILPIFIGTILQLDGIETDRAGWIGSADLIGYAVGSLIAFRLIRRFSWKELAVTGFTMMLAGNVATIIAGDSFAMIMLFRVALAGTGAGLVIAVPYTALATFPDSERATGTYWTFNVVGGSIALLIFPLVTDSAGPPGLFGALALLALAGITVSMATISGTPAPDPVLDATGDTSEDFLDSEPGLFARLRSEDLIILLAIVLFNLGLGGVWAFIDGPGRTIGLSGTSIGWILSGTYLVCMLGSATASWQGQRYGLAAPYLIAMCLTTLAIATLSRVDSPILYIGILATINFFWNYSMTYQFIAVFETSKGSHTATLIFFAQSMGLMFGPALAGSIAQNYSVESSFLVAASFCLLSALAYVLSINASKVPS